jgi:hypothetical protein
MMADILSCLTSNLQARPLEALLRYAQARQIFFDVLSTKNPSTQQAHRLLWIKKRAEPLFSDAEHIYYPDYFSKLHTIVLEDVAYEPVLYKLILASLWAKDATFREGATQNLSAIIDRIEPANIPSSRELLMLLQGWTMQHFIATGALSPAKIEILRQLVTVYFNDPAQAEMWREAFGIGFMEVGIYSFATRYKNFGPDFALQRGDANEYENWKNALYSFQQFCLLLDKPNGVGDLFSALGEKIHHARLGVQAQPSLELKDDRTSSYSEVAKWCYLEMLYKYSILIHSHFMAHLRAQENEKFIMNSHEYNKAIGFRDLLAAYVGDRLDPAERAPNMDERLSAAKDLLLDIMTIMNTKVAAVPHIAGVRGH